MPRSSARWPRRKLENVIPNRHTRQHPRPLRAALVTAGALGLVSFGTLAAPPAMATAADAEVAISGDLGEATASTEGETTLHLEGSGFQSVEGGFGGIYVMFGWVSGDGWAPSQGGTSGVDYLYVPDVQTADNAGYMKFVTFPGSGTADEANGGVLEADGTWATDLIVPGPVIALSDAAGNEREVDCLQETCGVITFGAHGVQNANNETFTPVTFVEPGTQDDDAEATATEEPTTEEESAEETTAEAPAVDDQEPESAASGSADTADSEDADSVSDQGSIAPWIIGGIVLAALAGVAIVLWRKRSTHRPGDSDDG